LLLLLQLLLLLLLHPGAGVVGRVEMVEVGVVTVAQSPVLPSPPASSLPSPSR
jgi:hypothetical protein